MALIFSTSITKLMTTSGISSILSPSNDNTAITVYSGTQPAAADIITNWASYTSSNANCLAHFNGCIWQTQPVGSSLAQVATYPTSTPAYSGIATWAILWCNMDVNASQLSGSVIPTSLFFVVPVSDTTGTGIIRFESTTFVAGTPVSVLDASILTNFVPGV
jgi:hypothetical protein